MGTKKVKIEFLTSEKLYSFIEVHAKLNDISINDAYIELLNAGIKEGASDINMALLEGAKKQTETIKIIADYNTFSKIGNSPIKTAKEVKKILEPNVMLAYDEQLMQQVIEDYLSTGEKS